MSIIKHLKYVGETLVDIKEDKDVTKIRLEAVKRQLLRWQDDIVDALDLVETQLLKVRAKRKESLDAGNTVHTNRSR